MSPDVILVSLMHGFWKHKQEEQITLLEITNVIYSSTDFARNLRN